MTEKLESYNFEDSLLEFLQDEFNMLFEGEIEYELKKDTDLLTDVPNFTMEQLDILVESIGDSMEGTPLIVYAEPSEPVTSEEEYFSKVSNILKALEAYGDDTAFAYEIDEQTGGGTQVEKAFAMATSTEEAPAPQEDTSSRAVNVYSLEDESFLSCMAKLRMHRNMGGTTLDQRVVECASSANESAADLLDRFIQHYYLGADEPSKQDILMSVEMVAYWVHMILSEYDLEKCEILAERKMEMDLDFESPVKIKHFQDMHCCVQMLVCVTSKLVDNAVSQSMPSSTSKNVEPDELLPGIHGIIAITHEIAQYCESDIWKLVKQ